MHGAGRHVVGRPSRDQRSRARGLPVAHEFFGRTICQGAMRSHLVVIKPPARKLLSDIVQIEEGFDVQAFIAQPAVKRFDIAIVDRLARTNKLQLYTILIAPRVHRPAGEFAAVVRREAVMADE